MTHYNSQTMFLYFFLLLSPPQQTGESCTRDFRFRSQNTANAKRVTSYPPHDTITQNWTMILDFQHQEKTWKTVWTYLLVKQYVFCSTKLGKPDGSLHSTPSIMHTGWSCTRFNQMRCVRLECLISSAPGSVILMYGLSGCPVGRNDKVPTRGIRPWHLRRSLITQSGTREVTVTRALFGQRSF